MGVSTSVLLLLILLICQRLQLVSFDTDYLDDDVQSLFYILPRLSPSHRTHTCVPPPPPSCSSLSSTSSSPRIPRLLTLSDMPDPSHRLSLPASIVTNLPFQPRRSTLVPSDHSSSSPASTPPVTPTSQTEFARNLAGTRGMSQAQNPRFRRHASLDFGAANFRSRVGSVYGTPNSLVFAPGDGGIDSPISPYHDATFDEKGRLLSVSHPQSPMYSPFVFTRRKAWWKDKKNVGMATAAAFSLFVFGGILGFSLLSGDGARTWWGVKTALEDYGMEFQHASYVPPPSSHSTRR